jgi:hypothetical protein
MSSISIILENRRIWDGGTAEALGKRAAG